MPTLRFSLLCPLLIIGCAGEPTPSPPAAARLEAVTVTDQQAPEGALVNDPPTVRALDAAGRPVAGVLVTFASSTGTVVSPTEMVSDADGLARTASWRLGTGAAETMASAAGVPAVSFRAEARPRRFDLVIRWQTPPPPEAIQAAAEAEALLESIIWEDLPDEVVTATPVCPLPGEGPTVTVDETIDDVLVIARIGPIDGLGGAGAQGFPCLIRDPGTQTIVGFIRLDEAEFAAIDQDLRREFVLHELVHALGLVPGVLNLTTPGGFSRNCLQLPSQGAPNPLVQDSHFSCPGARRGFDQIGGTRYAGLKVPLENGATRPLGANTLNHHWRKTSLRNELMTGWFIAGQRAPLSVVTVGALEDLGYRVSYPAAEPLVLDGAIAAGVGRGEAAVPLIELAAPGVPRVAPAAPGRRCAGFIRQVAPLC